MLELARRFERHPYLDAVTLTTFVDYSFRIHFYL